jgi:hypothetical protein
LLFNKLTLYTLRLCQHTPKTLPTLQVRVFQQHPEGVVTVRFKLAEPAEACVALMNGRFFGGRQLVAHMWDGLTQYHGVSVGLEERLGLV